MADQSSSSGDALDYLMRQHRETDALFDAFDQTTDNNERLQIVRDVTATLCVHGAIEEAVFYPTVKDALPERSSDIDQDRDEHLQQKRLLYEMQGKQPDDPKLVELFHQLVREVREHVNDEEQSLFPAVRKKLSAAHLRELKDTMTKVEKVAPTRPHPSEPQKAPLNWITAPLASAIDQLRDAIRNQTGSETV